MRKHEVLNRILSEGIIAIVRNDNPRKVIKIVESIKKGGIGNIEITMGVPGALEIINELSKNYAKDDDILLGVGTVLDAETARAAIIAGAKYVIMPTLNTDVIKLCNRYQVPCIPGVMTPSEIVSALECGASALKLFPASVVGPEMLRQIKAPLPQAILIPTGGVYSDNVEDWFAAGADAVGVGLPITKDADTEDYEAVTQNSRRFVEKIKKFRSKA